MKHYFKYSKGYINVNSEDLFLTNSGNWSETQELKEKSPATARLNGNKNFKFDFFIFILLVMVLVTTYQAINQTISKGVPILLIGISLAVYRYFRNETGNRYKIPLSKIKAVVVKGDEVTIAFINANGTEDSETIKGVEPKGITVLNEVYPDTVFGVS